MIVLVSGAEVLLDIKPLIDHMQDALQKLYPEYDFVFTEDEFMRDQPAPYELDIDWYRVDSSNTDRTLDFRITRFELIRPERIVRDMLNGFWPLTQLLNLKPVLLKYFGLRTNMPGFEDNTAQRLRLRW